MAKLLNLDATKDADALSQTYDFYLNTIMPTYPHLDIKAFQSTRDALVPTNPSVKDLDVTKVLADSYVADAEKRGVGKYPRSFQASQRGGRKSARPVSA